jgi:hypothetical protein
MQESRVSAVDGDLPDGESIGWTREKVGRIMQDRAKNRRECSEICWFLH